MQHHSPYYYLFIGFFLLAAQVALAQADVSVVVDFSTPTAAADEAVEARVTLRNEGDGPREALAVKLTTSPALFYLAAKVDAGGSTFDEANLLWKVPQLDSGAVTTLIVRVQANYGGVHTLSAELVEADREDWDSTPANNRASEDDQDSACISVPVEVACGQSLVLRAPTGHAGYSWYRDDVVLTYAVSDTLHPSSSGAYRYEINGDACSTGNCCPVIIDRGGCVSDLALVATKDNQRGEEGYETVVFTLYNQGGGAVSQADLYMTATRFMRLKPGTEGWALRGAQLSTSWTGRLEPGEKTEVQVEMQTVPGGNATDYEIFAEISAFYAGNDKLQDIDSTPDEDPTNDKLIDDAFELSADRDEDDSDVVSLSTCPLIAVVKAPAVCAGDAWTVYVKGAEPGSSFSWSGPVDFDCTTCEKVSLLAVEGAEVQVEVISPTGCTSVKTMQVPTKRCGEIVSLLTAPWAPGSTCLDVAAGTEVEWCATALPRGITLEDQVGGTEVCLRATTLGDWGGERSTCVNLCADGVCEEVTVNLIACPRLDEVDATPSETICLSEFLQVDATPKEVQVVPNKNGLTLTRISDECFSVIEPAGVYPSSSVEVIYSYLLAGMTIHDTTVVTLPGKDDCVLQAVSLTSVPVVRNLAALPLEGGTTVCIPGDVAQLERSSFVLDGRPVFQAAGNCEVLAQAEYVVTTPLSDNGWTVERLFVANQLVLRNRSAKTLAALAYLISREVDNLTAVATTAPMGLRLHHATEQPASLKLKHQQTNTSLLLQPTMLNTPSGIGLTLPADLVDGNYALTITGDNGCIQQLSVEVSTIDDTQLVRDTVFATVELLVPYAACGLAGFEAEGAVWTPLDSDCYTFTPTELGDQKPFTFVKTEDLASTERTFVLTAVEPSCTPLFAAANVSRSSRTCEPVSVPLGLTRPGLRVSGGGAGILQTDQATGSRSGRLYDLSKLPHGGQTGSYRIKQWTGQAVPAPAEALSLAQVVREFRLAGADVFVDWTKQQLYAAGNDLEALVLTSYGAEISLPILADRLPTFGQALVREGTSVITASLAGSCPAEFRASVRCSRIIVGLPQLFSFNAGRIASLPTTEIGLAPAAYNHEVTFVSEGFEVNLDPGMARLSFQSETPGVGYAVVKSCPEGGEDCTETRINLTVTDSTPQCAFDPWSSTTVDLIAGADGLARFVLPEVFDRDRTAVYLDGRQKRGGYVKRDAVVEQAFAVSTETSLVQLATPSGKTVQVAGGDVQAALAQLLGEARARTSDEGRMMAHVNGAPEKVYGQDVTGIWAPVDEDEGRVAPRYSLQLEAGEHVLVLEAPDATCRDTVTVLVRQPELSGTKDEVVLRVGEQTRYCLPKAQAGKTVVAIENNCEEAGGELASVVLEEACVALEAFEVGEEQVCLTRRYLDGSTDSLQLHIRVEDQVQLTTLADKDTIEFGQFKVLEVLSNDELADEPRMVSLISEPFFGRAQVVGNSAIEYLHYGSDCAVDVFTYEVCQGEICDSATVEVNVFCDDLLVYNGFSPNGDGVNDELTILGLGQYPNHELSIFNRQGNLLITFTDYDSDWRGEIGGQPLNAGTYFYVIDLGDGNQESGYIQLSR